jgi:hypothetical protein
VGQASRPANAIYWLASPGISGQNRDMKRFSILTAFLCLFAFSSLFAQGKIDLQASDTVLGILQKNVGQTVELRMKSGEKIAGKVEKVGDKLIHLSQLTGAEFYDAAVEAADVSAVVVRMRK